MSLQPEAAATIPDETARIARAAFPKGTLALRLRDLLGPLFDDTQFADLFATRGRPALAPWRLALVTVLQYAEGLTDQQAADAVRGRLDWKYALGLDLTYAGWDASVLSEFRSRLVAAGAEQRLLDLLLDRCVAAGYLKARGRQRTDATHVLGALRRVSRLELVAETLRAALERLAATDAAWLQAHADPAWGERYGRRVEEYRLPKSETARQAYAAQVGADGLALLGAVTAADAAAALRALPAVETLRQVWLQQFVVLNGDVQLRAPQDQPPAAQLVISPYDVEARAGQKRQTYWAGYTLHVTESCDAERPHLLTELETTPAPVADVTTLPQIQATLAAKDRLPGEQLVDTGYVSGQTVVASQREHQVTLLGPMYVDHQWQAQAGDGYSLAAFGIDWGARQVTCPQGAVSRGWAEVSSTRGPLITVRFAPQSCTPCPVRERCTRAVQGPRKLTLRPQAEHEAIVAARARQAPPAFATAYAARAGIEGTLSQAVRRCGARQARYRGLAKTRLQHVATGAALNCVRVVAWEAGQPQATTRQSRVATLIGVPAGKPEAA